MDSGRIETVERSLVEDQGNHPAGELGADEVFNYQDAAVGEMVAELTGGRGVDVVIDTVAGRAGLAATRAADQSAA